MSPERRRSKRHPAKLQTEVELGGVTRRGSITRDASETGLLLVTDVDAEVGDPVIIRCELGGTLLSTTATVARCEPSAEPGLREMALVFTAKNPLFAEIFRQLAQADS